MNNVVITGNLAAEPEMRTTSNGNANCTFRVAVQRPFTNSNGVREADFLIVVCWRQTADYVGKYLHKGSKVAVSGSIQTRNYEKDGHKVYITEIIADRVESIGTKTETNRNTASSNESYESDASEDSLPF